MKSLKNKKVAAPARRRTAPPGFPQGAPCPWAPMGPIKVQKIYFLIKNNNIYSYTLSFLAIYFHFIAIYFLFLAIYFHF